jgi:hypothetical protein
MGYDHRGLDSGAADRGDAASGGAVSSTSSSAVERANAPDVRIAAALSSPSATRGASAGETTSEEVHDSGSERDRRPSDEADRPATVAPANAPDLRIARGQLSVEAPNVRSPDLGSSTAGVTTATEVGGESARSNVDRSEDPALESVERDPGPLLDEESSRDGLLAVSADATPHHGADPPLPGPDWETGAHANHSDGQVSNRPDAPAREPEPGNALLDDIDNGPDERLDGHPTSASKSSAEAVGSSDADLAGRTDDTGKSYWFAEISVDLSGEKMEAALRKAVDVRAVEAVNTLSNRDHGPVITGLLDTRTGAVFVELNHSAPPAELHPLLRERFSRYVQENDGGFPARAGPPGAHSEIYALNKALCVREAQFGRPARTEDLSEFSLYNRSLRGVSKLRGVPPLCANCAEIIPPQVRVVP